MLYLDDNEEKSLVVYPDVPFLFLFFLLKEKSGITGKEWKRWRKMLIFSLSLLSMIRYRHYDPMIHIIENLVYFC